MSIGNGVSNPSASHNFQLMQDFSRRDERGGAPQIGEKPSFTADQAAEHIAASGPPTWTDTNGNGKTELSYSFLKRAPMNFHAAGLTGFSAFNPQEQKDMRQAMQNYQDVGNVTFTEEAADRPSTDDEGHVSFANFAGTLDPTKGMRGATLPSVERKELHSFYRNTPMPDTAISPSPDAPKPFLMRHELGHQLGYGHPGFYNGNHTLGFEKAQTYKQDTNAYSVMSYWPETHSGHDFTKNGIRHYPKGLMMDDIAVTQATYGANHQSRSGNTVYGFESNADRDYYHIKSNDDAFVASIWDGAGHDTVNMSGYRDNQKINLNPGTFSDVGGMKGNLSIAPGAIIEDAYGGSGNDLMLGNSASNSLVGGAGDDVIDGGAGQGRLWGGAGKDIFVFSQASHSTAKAPDTIMDFRTGEDLVDVSNIRVATGKPALKYVDAFTGQPGEALLKYNPKKRLSTLEIDLHGKGMADFKVKIKGKISTQDIVS